MMCRVTGSRGLFEYNHEIKYMKKILIQAITSDIGFNLANYWLDKGVVVYGTFRNESEKLEKLVFKYCIIIFCAYPNNTSTSILHIN